MLRATIDIGSNSVLLLLAQVEPYKEIAKLSEVTGLGRGLDKTQQFSQIAMDETYEALEKYKRVCQENGLDPASIIATATEASRVAKNAPDFFNKIQSELGITIQTITGEGEAYLTTRGILFDSNFSEDSIVIMDIGGASTELIKVNPKTFEISKSISLGVGSVRVTDWLKEGIFTNALSKLLTDHSAEIDQFHTKTLYCVAGTLTSLGNMHLGNKEFVESDVHGLKMQKEDIEKLFQKYSSFSATEFLELFPFLGKRSEAIRGGLMLTTHLVQRLKITNVVVSTYGLRYGTFLEGRVPDEFIAG
jgi:exopolyphosphatase / guanosine-5'-triphosphate,3'-diphosphate pyrophosphatase